MPIDDSRGYDLLDRLVEEFAARFRRGERPSLKEYIDRYPELADEIREVFPALISVEQVEEICNDRDEADRAKTAPPLSQVGDYRIVREIGHGGMGVVYEAEQLSLGRRVALKVLPWQVAKDRNALERFRREARASARLHHTNIVPVFEVGQEGEVRYYAMQFIQGQSLDAVIDELRRLRSRSLRERGRRPSAGGDDDDRSDRSGKRGHAEDLGVARSLLTGRFQQVPTVVSAAGEPPDSAVGSVESEPVVKAVPDTSAVMPGGAQLSTVESRHRAYHRGVAQIGRQAASALAHAHARGILHRDIKPSNLLLDTNGVVWVSDFGLAKVDDDELTRTGDILGTLRYMAPERFRGQGDTRADLYSLGLTLYELLALRPAFDSPDRVALSEQIRSVEPPRPRSIDPRIPRDLETIVLKAIEKEPGDRYASAETMAEDLRRFLDDEPILARRVGAHERYLRWARRNPVIAVLGAVLTAVLVGATIASVLAAGQMAALARANERAATSERGAKLAALAAQTQAEAQRGEADRQRERAERHVYNARIGEADGALRLFDSATARTLLDQCRPGPGEPDRRGWEWSYLDQWCSPELRTIALPTAAQSRCVAVSPDGRLLAVGCWDPDAVNHHEFPPVPVYLISLPDGRVRHALPGHNLVVQTVAFRPDGRCLATIGEEGTIRLWDTSGGRPLRTVDLGSRVHSPAHGLSWSPDGRRLASTAQDIGLIRIWDPETGRETARIAQKGRDVAWSPDGTRIASALVEHLGLEVRAWDAREERLNGPILTRPGWADSLTWSPDGRRLAVASVETDSGWPGWGVTVWDATSGDKLFRKEHVTGLSSVAFSPDGTRLATGGEEGIVRVFDAADGRERAALFTGCTSVNGLAFSPDGRRLLAAGWGMGGVKVFDPARDPRGRNIPDWPDQIAALTFDRDGLRVLGCAWNVGGLLASADPVDGTIACAGVLPVTNSNRWPRGDFAVSRDGVRFAAPTWRDRTVVGVWDVALGRAVARLRGSGGPISAVAFGPDGRSLATAAAGGPKGRPIVTLWHLDPGRAIRTFEAGPDPVEALALSGDGRKLAAGGGRRPGAPGWGTAWDAETGAVLGTLDRVGYVKFLAFHPDGVRIAVADQGDHIPVHGDPDRVHLWDLAAGTRITHPGPKFVCCVGFTPDGERLAALGYDGNVHLADARTGEDVLVLRGFGPPVGSRGYTPRMAFSPDGSRIAGQYPDLLNLWDLGPQWGLAAEPGARDIAGWLRRSRALAEADDDAGAEAAAARAGAIPGGDAYPWIEHAVSLYRRGDFPEARDALARAVEAPPDDPGRWIDLGRLLGQLGWTEGLETVRAKARTLLERRLARATDDEPTAVALAELLPDADASPGWTIIKPTQMKSEGGATLTVLDDSSILAGGKNPDRDVYSLVAKTDLREIHAIRLEALSDPSLPKGGPGRSASGNFNLGELRVFSGGQRVTLTKIIVAYDQGHGFRNVIAGRVHQTGGWSNAPRAGKPNTAIVATRLQRAPDDDLKIEMSFSPAPRWPQHGLGRFRLSVTSRPFPLFEPSLRWLKADWERNGRTRLGAAYFLLGDWASAAAVLERAAARPEATALDGFLLALARHHVGRPDQARSDCDRALERLKSEQADEPTRDVGIEALMTIRGLSVEEAEALLLDLVFPTEAFGPL